MRNAPLQDLKNDLRAHALNARIRHIATQEAVRAADYFLTHVPVDATHRIALYQPIKGELNIEPLAEHLRIRGVDFFYVPTGSTAPLPTQIPTIVLVPLLAVDQDGYRLGYGGGYYDRWIHRLREARQDPPIRIIGYGFDFQRITDRLPREATDEPLDGLVTDQGYWDFRR